MQHFAHPFPAGLAPHPQHDDRKRQKYALCCQMEHRAHFHDTIIPARCVAPKQPHGLISTSQSYNAYFWAVWVLSGPNLGHQPEFRPREMASGHTWRGPHPANQQDEGLSYLGESGRYRARPFPAPLHQARRAHPRRASGDAGDLTQPSQTVKHSGASRSTDIASDNEMGRNSDSERIHDWVKPPSSTANLRATHKETAQKKTRS